MTFEEFEEFNMKKKTQSPGGSALSPTEVISAPVRPRADPASYSSEEVLQDTRPYKEDALSELNLSALQHNLGHCLGIIENEVMKGYVTRLSSLPIRKPDTCINQAIPDIHFFRISELVYQEDEFSVDKLAMVFHALSNRPCTLVLMLKSDGEKTDFYLGARPVGMNSAGTLFQMLKQSLLGFFPGSRIREYYDEDMKKDLEALEVGCVSGVTCIADYKQKEDAVSNRDFIQGLEKFVYAMQGKSYTAVLIADQISHEDLMLRKREYEQIYTQISPFAEMQMNFSVSDGTSASDGSSEGRTKSASYTKTHGVSNSNTDTKTVTSGSSEATGVANTRTKTHTKSNSESDGTSHTDGTSDGTSRNVTNGMNMGSYFGSSANGGLNLGPVNVGGGVNTGITGGYNRSVSNGTSHTDSVSDSVSRTLTHGLSESEGHSRSDSKTYGTSRIVGDSKSTGSSVSNGVSDTTGESFNLVHTRTLTDTFGSSKGVTLHAKNMTLNLTLQKIQKHLERIEECESFGMWNFAAYFLGESAAETETAANLYKSVIAGMDSGIERSAINTWTDEASVRDLSVYLKNFVHPQFIYQGFSYDGDRYLAVNPSALVSTNELAIHMGLPRHSVRGLPVVEHAQFAQEIITRSDCEGEKVKLGSIYNLGQKTGADLELDLQSLAMHTFLTGSTGSGKSNTIYKMLEELDRQSIPFLVIEPAKGEYKNMFGSHADVRVFGTNPQHTGLLRINPFRFPEGIHILEHIDRLIEIFNVCWPMYAAMPAVLKDAVLQTYESCGWDLARSENRFSRELFPSFADLLCELSSVIQGSAYSEEVKSNYTGSLVTRIRSLTNGLNGQIFTADEVDNCELFDRKTIIDISRVSSSETKSLIMGILIMRLSEHRMSACTAMNVPLRHITVLEEAHNILKSPSASQNAEGADIAGKSVEMISNAIAEMRTYGEGFMIVDQSPGAVDISAIRNTNTKIIMRLPDEKDRRFAGKSAGLKDCQLEEITKLPKGVAVVYQNDWTEPVLCKMDRFEGEEHIYRNPQKTDHSFAHTARQSLMRELLHKLAGEKLEQTVGELTHMLTGMELPARTKIKAFRALRTNGACLMKDVSAVVYDLSCSPAMEQEAEMAESVEEWRNTFVYAEDSVLADLSETQQNTAVEYILKEQIERYGKPVEYLETWNQFLKGEVM